jgi:hypothetical protein
VFVRACQSYGITIYGRLECVWYRKKFNCLLQDKEETENNGENDQGMEEKNDRNATAKTT